MMWGYGWGGALAMTLGMLLWLGALAVLIWALVRWTTDRAPQSVAVLDTRSSKEILRQRYARGELDEATFERMRARVETASSPTDQPMAVGR